MKMLEWRDVQLSVNNKLLLQCVSGRVNRGELVVVLGPNGAGKSSLLKVASGELTPQAGDVQFFGQALSGLALADKAQQMAVLPQHSQLEFAFTVREVVSLGRIPHSTGVKRDGDIVNEVLAMLDVAQFAGQHYTRLSGGEKQRVQLARVLAQVWDQPAMLILDEPTAALDFSHQQQIMQVLKHKTQRGAAVLMVLHDVNLAASFADRVIMMKQGQIAAEGEPAAVLREALLSSVFDLPFYPVTHPETGTAMFVN